MEWTGALRQRDRAGGVEPGPRRKRRRVRL